MKWRDIMATVTCKYCKKKFDRDKEPYIQIPWGEKAFRYAHAACYLDEVNHGREKQQYTVWDPAIATTCFWCHQAIYPNQTDVELVPQLTDRYMHKTCGLIHPADEKEELMVFLIKLFGLKEDYILPKYMIQIQEYIKKYGFSYSGIKKTLIYWYEIKKQPVNEEFRLSIVPRIYNEARRYYEALWNAQQANQVKNIKDFIPQDIEVNIKAPQRQLQKRKLFTFLDEEEINGDK